MTPWLPGLFLLTTITASADTMRCSGPGQAYTAKLDRDHRSMTIEGLGKPLSYKVEAIDGPRVSGITAENGPAFRAFFDSNRHVELYHHGKLMKTDLCR